MSLRCNILLSSELEVQTIRSHATKSYTQAIEFHVFLAAVNSFVKFSNRTEVGILVIQQLWPLSSAFPTFSQFQLWVFAQAEPALVSEQSSEQQSQLRKGS